jgi:hypothetical protein
MYCSAEKLTRLEAENKRLTEQQQSASFGRVADLESSLDDMTRLKITFEKVCTYTITKELSASDQWLFTSVSISC